MDFILDLNGRYTEDQLEALGIVRCLKTTSSQPEYELKKDRRERYFMKRLKDGQLEVWTRFTQYIF